MAVGGATGVGPWRDDIFTIIATGNGTCAAAGDVDRHITAGINVIGRVRNDSVAAGGLGMADDTAVTELLIGVARIGTDMHQMLTGEIRSNASVVVAGITERRVTPVDRLVTRACLTVAVTIDVSTTGAVPVVSWIGVAVIGSCHVDFTGAINMLGLVDNCPISVIDR